MRGIVPVAAVLLVGLAGCNNDRTSDGMAADEPSRSGTVAVSKVETADTIQDIENKADAFVTGRATDRELLDVNGIPFTRSTFEVTASSVPELVGTSVKVRQTGDGTAEVSELPGILDPSREYTLALTAFEGPQEVDQEYVITFDEGIWERTTDGPRNVAVQSGSANTSLEATTQELSQLTQSS
ncbi:hypothetical protein [Kytococcus sedentarius]|uniref:hypothetical protein n=1 Tax=Kytococcus sedentarius TaxID=1276 RepID=UPI0035BC2364